MISSTGQILTDTAKRVMEQAAFLFADDIDEIDNDLDVGVSVLFQGNRNGRLELWTVHEFAKVIADNLLGEDNSSDVEKNMIRQIDALKEMLNMITGNLLTELFGTEPIFNLEIPDVIQGVLSSDKVPAGASLLSVEEFPVVLILTLEEKNDQNHCG